MPIISDALSARSGDGTPGAYFRAQYGLAVLLAGGDLISNPFFRPLHKRNQHPRRALAQLFQMGLDGPECNCSALLVQAIEATMNIEINIPNTGHKRAARTVSYALTLGTSDAWLDAAYVIAARLTVAERVSLAYPLICQP